MSGQALEQSSADFYALTASWLMYVRGERDEAGMNHHLPHSARCFCGKSNTSYPHWPPTTHREAMAQLRCLTGRSHPHRLYLADCWVVWLRRQQVQTGTAEMEDLISLVGNACVKRARSSQRNDVEQFRRSNMDCQGICKPVLEMRTCFCLCCCPEHREDCPVHRCG